MWPFRKRSVPEISWFSGESAEMNEAIAEAQATFPHFSDVLAGNGDRQSLPDLALVKYGFRATRPGAVVEHVFVGDVVAKDGDLWGVVNADPAYTDEVAEGDLIKIDRDRVSDWLYVIDRKGTGGFTFKLMWKNFSPAEQDAYRDQAPFVWLVNQFS